MPRRLQGQIFSDCEGGESPGEEPKHLTWPPLLFLVSASVSSSVKWGGAELEKSSRYFLMLTHVGSGHRKGLSLQGFPQPLSGTCVMTHGRGCNVGAENELRWEEALCHSPCLEHG